MTELATVSLRLPVGWIETDPREPDILGALLTQSEVGNNREEMALLLAPLAVRLSRLAASGDLVLAGFYTDVVEIEGETSPLVMSAQVSLALSPPVGDLDRLRELWGGDGTAVEPVDLPAGRGVVVTGTTQVDDDQWSGSHPAHLRRYFVPVPGLSRVAALSFLTPNIDLVEAFDGVFDAIAATLSFD